MQARESGCGDFYYCLVFYVFAFYIESVRLLALESTAALAGRETACCTTFAEHPRIAPVQVLISNDCAFLFYRLNSRRRAYGFALRPRDCRPRLQDRGASDGASDSALLGEASIAAAKEHEGAAKVHLGLGAVLGHAPVGVV
jgi:hypothetical protein